MTDKQYLAKFDEVRSLASASYETWFTSSDRKKAKRKVKDDFLEFLIEAYLFGNIQTEEQLGASHEEPTLGDIEGVVYDRIEGETFEDRVDKHLDAEDKGLLCNLAESEYHRVFTHAMENAAKRIMEWTGLGYKTWHTMEDDRVRDTHTYLDGVKIRVKRSFSTYDGDYAMRPGAFRLPENNCGCRCWLTYSWF